MCSFFFFFFFFYNIYIYVNFLKRPNKDIFLNLGASEMNESNCHSIGRMVLVEEGSNKLNDRENHP